MLWCQNIVRIRQIPWLLLGVYDLLLLFTARTLSVLLVIFQRHLTFCSFSFRIVFAVCALSHALLFLFPRLLQPQRSFVIAKCNIWFANGLLTQKLSNIIYYNPPREYTRILYALRCFLYFSPYLCGNVLYRFVQHTRSSRCLSFSQSIWKIISYFFDSANSFCIGSGSMRELFCVICHMSRVIITNWHLFYVKMNVRLS